MNDEKARAFLDWLLSDQGPELAKEALMGFGDFGELEIAARRHLGPRYHEVLVACRVIHYFEERRKMDPDPARSSTARYVPIRQFMDAFFMKHPEFHEYQTLLDYYLTKIEAWDDTIYVPAEQSPNRARASLTGIFMAIKDGLVGRARKTPV